MKTGLLGVQTGSEKRPKRKHIRAHMRKRKTQHATCTHTLHIHSIFRVAYTLPLPETTAVKRARQYGLSWAIAGRAQADGPSQSGYIQASPNGSVLMGGVKAGEPLSILRSRPLKWRWEKGAEDATDVHETHGDMAALWERPPIRWRGWATLIRRTRTHTRRATTGEQEESVGL